MTNAGPSPLRLRHLALHVRDLAGCERFYTEVLGLEVAWRPDESNVYLQGEGDSLALHRLPRDREGDGHLDHLGFFVDRPADVDLWHARVSSRGATVCGEPRTHRDGARSFYCQDPDGNTVQILHLPPREGEPAGEASA